MRSSADPAELMPQPDLGQVQALVQNAEAAGLSVSYVVDGEPVPVPPGLALSAYRIVQEAITNTLKHAHGTRLCVQVSYGPRELRVAVSDDGPDTRTPGRPRSPDTASPGCASGSRCTAARCESHPDPRQDSRSWPPSPCEVTA